MKEVKKRLMTQKEYNAFMDRIIKNKKGKSIADIYTKLIEEIDKIEIISEGKK